MIRPANHDADVIIFSQILSVAQCNFDLRSRNTWPWWTDTPRPGIHGEVESRRGRRHCWDEQGRAWPFWIFGGEERKTSKWQGIPQAVPLPANKEVRLQIEWSSKKKKKKKHRNEKVPSPKTINLSVGLHAHSSQATSSHRRAQFQSCHTTSHTNNES